ncbi:MAG: FAD:protein FMN transferase, partial [Thiotrichaceae bacterium]
AKATIGYQHLKTSDNPSQLIKDIPLLQIDLSAIAKGYAVDRVATLIDERGIQNYLVEIGGEIKVRGLNPKAENWQIAIEKPIIDSSANKKQIAHQIIPLENIAVATSGDYHNYFEEKGVRYSHTLDPKTGKPVTHQLASVTVLHESAMMADGYATAIMVLGDKKGLAFAKKEGLQVLMLVRDKDKFITLSTLRDE